MFAIRTSRGFRVLLCGLISLITACGAVSSPFTASTVEPTPTIARKATAHLLLPAEPPIYYFADDGDNYALATINPDGSAQTTLIADWATVAAIPGFREMPALAPNARRIAYRVETSAEPGLYIASIDGKNVRRLTEDANHSEPSWSPDGNHLVFDQITMIRRRGEARERPTDSDLYIINADGGRPQMLTSGAGWDTDPDWSPDGEKIAFISDRPDANGQRIYNLWTMNADGSNPVNLTNFTALHLQAGQPDWSPDGSQIVFRVWNTQTNVMEFWLIDADGSDMKILTPQDQWIYEPDWSPDGEYIAYIRSNSPDPGYALYVMSADGTGGVYVTDVYDNRSGVEW